MSSDVKTAFFSYSREDQDFALKLAQDLRAGGAEIWMDQIDIEPGTAWDRAVQAALESSPRVLVILSPRSASSDNVSDEVSFALDNHKHVIPVLYRDCDVPLRLRRLQYVDFRVDYAQGLGRLLKALSLEAAAIAAAFSAEGSGSGRSFTSQSVPAATSGAPAVTPASTSDSATRKPLSIGMKLGAAIVALLLLLIVIWSMNRSRTNEREGERKKQPETSQSSEQRSGSNAEQNESLLPSSLSSKWAPTYHQAVAGDAASMADLGWVYFNGDGARRDYAEAQKWFQKAADAGNANGMAGMGSIYMEVRGTPADDKKAFEWYQKASDGGNPYGMYSLGYMYEYGRGVPKDMDLAIGWYRKAAKAGSDYARNSLKRLGVKP